MAGRLVRGAATAWSQRLVHAPDARWAVRGEGAATRRAAPAAGWVAAAGRHEGLQRGPEGTGAARTWWAPGTRPSSLRPARCLLQAPSGAVLDRQGGAARRSGGSGLSCGGGRRGFARGRQRHGAARWGLIYTCVCVCVCVCACACACA